ncbi:hypothetical protein D3C84_180700 [compost metagenome]
MQDVQLAALQIDQYAAVTGYFMQVVMPQLALLFAHQLGNAGDVRRLVATQGCPDNGVRPVLGKALAVAAFLGGVDQHGQQVVIFMADCRGVVVGAGSLALATHPADGHQACPLASSSRRSNSSSSRSFEPRDWLATAYSKLASSSSRAISRLM